MMPPGLSPSKEDIADAISNNVTLDTDMAAAELVKLISSRLAISLFTSIKQLPIKYWLERNLTFISLDWIKQYTLWWFELYIFSYF